jgi:peptidoglycan hydrolase-like protein with peptidoglycan-binding domain
MGRYVESVTIVSQSVDNFGWSFWGDGWQPLVLMKPFTPSTQALPAARRRPTAAALALALAISLPAAAGSPAQALGAPVSGASVSSVSAVPAAGLGAAATYTLGERRLSRGDSGPDVRALQALLDVKQTGRFNKRTRKAVNKVKVAAGLKVDGVVGGRALRAIKRDARARAAARSSRSLPSAGSPAASKRYARAYIARRYGWGDAQMSCLIPLWERESGWRYWVSNPNGIYRGIPQTSSRVWGPMGYTTSQYMNSPEIQIKVGASYIKGRYGSPCNALSFWNGHHWY